MPEVAKCPYCNGDPDVGYEYSSGKRYPASVECCGHSSFGEKDIISIEKWNRYAAAMELAKAAIRQDECEQKLSGLTTDLFFETHKESKQADLDCWKAFEKVKEVFK